MVSRGRADVSRIQHQTCRKIVKATAVWRFNRADFRHTVETQSMQLVTGDNRCRSSRVALTSVRGTLHKSLSAFVSRIVSHASGLVNTFISAQLVIFVGRSRLLLYYELDYDENISYCDILTIFDRLEVAYSQVVFHHHIRAGRYRTRLKRTVDLPFVSVIALIFLL